MAQGYVYILFNPALRQNRFKIGLTTNKPEERARELSSATGVPEPFEVAYAVCVLDCANAEKLVHAKLSKFRSGKEFFELPLATAIRAVEEVASKVGRLETEDEPEEVVETVDQLTPASGQEFDLATPGRRVRNATATLNGPVRFEDHLQRTDAPRQELLLELRKRILALGSDIVETVTPASRIAYNRRRVFVEVKVHKDCIRVLFLDIPLNDPRGMVVEKSFWGHLKYLMKMRTTDDLEYAMGFITSSYSRALAI